MSTATDSRLDWLRCGEALSALLLACTDRRFATCPVTHLTESGETRTRLRELTGGGNLPQVLIRVGIPRRPESTIAVTTRRPLSGVLIREHPVAGGTPGA
ncbi:hypothetical protein [Rhodococcus sp. NPDC057529]|uniref:hypothetical protein n=1 Tax=Rhodococcus sp. NPDC057529 TaxID=3346158 RepID=UPI00366E8B6D